MSTNNSDTDPKQRARTKLEQQLESKLGEDLQPGKDFTVTREGDQFRAELTDEFRRETAAQRLEERLREKTDLRLEAGEDFRVEQTDDGGFRAELGSTPRLRGAALRRVDPEALTAESQVEQGAEFVTVSRREIGAARRREDADNLTAPSQQEQGAEFEQVPGGSGPAPGERTEKSPPTSRRSGDAPADASDQPEGVSGVRDENIQRVREGSADLQDLPADARSRAERGAQRIREGSLDLSGTRTTDQEAVDTTTINGKPRGRPVGRRRPDGDSENVTPPDVSVRGLAEGFEENITDPAASLAGRAGRVTGEIVGRAAALAPDRVTTSVASQFGPQAEILGEVAAETDPDTASEVAGEATSRFAEGVGRGGVGVLNVPRTAIETKEAVEFSAAGTGAALRGEGGDIVEGNVLSGDAEFFEGGFAEKRVEPAVDRAVRGAKANPLRVAGQVAGGLAASAGTIGAAGALGGTRLGRAAAAGIQPAEEALISGARALRGTRLEAPATRVASTVGDLSRDTIRNSDRQLFGDGPDRGQADLTLGRGRGETDTETDTETEPEIDSDQVQTALQQTERVTPFPQDIGTVPDADLRKTVELDPEGPRADVSVQELLRRGQETETAVDTEQPTGAIEDLAVPGRPFTGLDVRSAGPLARTDTDTDQRTRLDQRQDVRVEDTQTFEGADTRTEALLESATGRELDSRVETRLEAGLDTRLDQRTETRTETGLRTDLRSDTRIDTRLEPELRQDTRVDTRTDTRQRQDLRTESELRAETRFELTTPPFEARAEPAFPVADEPQRPDAPDPRVSAADRVFETGIDENPFDGDGGEEPRSDRGDGEDDEPLFSFDLDTSDDPSGEAVFDFGGLDQ